MNEKPVSPAVSVVVPVFNEEENMSILQTELQAALVGLDYEIVFVDDGSTDRSADKIEAAQLRHGDGPGYAQTPRHQRR